MLIPDGSVPALSPMAAGGFFALGATMSPRATLEPDDIVTPGQAAELLDLDPNLVRVWIHRHGIEPLGKLGRWQVYDFNDIAAIELSHRRKEREAA
jgi:hypothetical protein